jgi:multiple sugar transport system substrate-binding protein
MKIELGKLMAIGLSVAIAGCQSTERTPTKIVVTLGGWQSNPQEGKRLDEVLRQFTAKYPQIEVRRETINSQYMDTLKTRLIGEVAPDVFYLDAVEAPAMMKYGVLESLDGYIKPEFQLEDFEPNLLSAFRYEGTLYGIPKDFSTLALFYNTDAFREVGLRQPPQTWQQLQEMAEKLTIDTDRNGKIDRYGMGLIPELSRQVFTIEAFGGKLIDANSRAAFAEPAGLQGLQSIVDWYRQGNSTAQPADVGSQSQTEAFGRGKIAMAIDGPWAIPYLRETFPKLKFTTAQVPMIAGRRGTMAYTVAYAMNSRAKNKAAAWQLIEFLTSRSGMKTWTNGGVALPSRRSVAHELKYDRHPLYSSFIQGTSYATLWQGGEYLPTISTNFDNQFLAAILGKKSLTEALRNASDTANKEIELAE